MTRSIALITGASRGLGRNMALHLAKRGVHIIGTYRSGAAEAESLKQHIYCCLQQMYQKPATALWAKILDERYISSRIGQIQLADQYHMSFSTFRRQQQQAQHCLLQRVWQLELQAREARRG